MTKEEKDDKIDIKIPQIGWQLTGTMKSIIITIVVSFFSYHVFIQLKVDLITSMLILLYILTVASAFKHFLCPESETYQNFT